MSGAIELSIFEEAGEALRGLAPAELGEYRHRAHRYGVKVCSVRRHRPASTTRRRS